MIFEFCFKKINTEKKYWEQRSRTKNERGFQDLKKEKGNSKERKFKKNLLGFS